MADTATVQVIHPPDQLRARLGHGFRGVDPDATARAAAALQRLSPEFDAWLGDEVAGLAAAHDSFVADATPSARSELHRRAHDLKGLAGTCGFPLVTRVCASLCQLLEAQAASAPLVELVDAHVAAARTLLRDRARGTPTPAALAVCAALEAGTIALAAAGDPGG